MKTQYQVVIQWLEGHFAPVSGVIGLKEAIDYRNSYNNKKNIFITKVTSRVMTEDEIEQVLKEK